MKKKVFKVIKFIVIIYLFLLFIQIGFIVPARSFDDLQVSTKELNYLNRQGSEDEDKYPGSSKVPIVRSLAVQGKGTAYESSIPYQFRFRLSARPLQSFILVSEYSWFSFIVGKKIDSFIDSQGWQRQNQRVLQNEQLTDWQQFILRAMTIWSPAELYSLEKEGLQLIINDGLPEMLVDKQDGFKAELKDWGWHYGIRIPEKILFYKDNELQLRLMVEQIVLSSKQDLWELDDINQPE